MQLRHKKYHLTFNIGFPLILFLSLTIFTTNFFNKSKFENTLRKLEKERYLFIANDLKNNIEIALDWGLTLNNLENIPQLMKEIIIENNDIEQISVFDDLSDIVFQASKELNDIQDNRNNYLYINVLLKNASDENAGKIVIKWSKNVKQGIINLAFTKLDKAAWFALLISLVVGNIGIWFLLTGFNQRLAKLQDLLSDNLEIPPQTNYAKIHTELENDPNVFKQNIGQYLYGVSKKDIGAIVKQGFSRLFMLQNIINNNISKNLENTSVINTSTNDIEKNSV